MCDEYVEDQLNVASKNFAKYHGGVPAPLQVRGGLCQQAELREEGGEQAIWGGGAST